LGIRGPFRYSIISPSVSVVSYLTQNSRVFFLMFSVWSLPTSSFLLFHKIDFWQRVVCRYPPVTYTSKWRSYALFLSMYIM